MMECFDDAMSMLLGNHQIIKEQIPNHRQRLMEGIKTEPKVPAVKVGGDFLRANQCIHSLLGDRIDFSWDKEEAIMDVSPSKATQFSHTVKDQLEVFQGVPFRHSEKCPLLEPELEKNETAVVKPCVVVLIQNKDNKRILGTQRHEHMSFGNKWVLPGGHLEQGESLLAGGLRECEEEVGLKWKLQESTVNNEQHDLMVWESVLVDRKLMKIKRAALVVFFRIECEHFEVIQQKSEVKAWEWRSFGAEEFPWGEGWAEGHLSYLSTISKTKPI